MLFLHSRVTRGNDDQIAVDAVADESLLAVENDLVAVFHSRCFHCRQITAGVGLRHGYRCDDIA